ncbi:MAG: SDR family oxidoreductase [Chloroflexota bacterium]|nr:SDR family oxidoreductase [Chloroflexota bacterium]
MTGEAAANEALGAAPANAASGETADIKVALVTGGASGIGRATAQRLRQDGHRTALVDIDAAGLARTVADLGGPAAALAIVADVRSFDQCRRSVDEALAWGGRLDIVVNCAGVWVEGPTDLMTEQDWDGVVDVNLKGTFFICRHAIPALVATGGCIVNVSSDAGLWGNKGAAIYSASKGGVTVLSKALAVELAERGVRVNAVCPGDVDSPMLEYQAQTFGGGDRPGYLAKLLEAYPQRPARFIRPDEVAELIAFLCSERAIPITGAAISIDFGLTAGY